MTHEEFTGVTFNDLNPSKTQISSLSGFSIVNSTEIALNVQRRVHIFTRRWLLDIPIFAISNPSVCP